MATLRIHVREFSESFYVTDPLDRRLAYVCFEDNPIRRSQSKRVSKDEVREIINMIAAALNTKFQHSPSP